MPTGPEQCVVCCKGHVPDRSVLVGEVRGRSQVSAWWRGEVAIASVVVTKVPDRSVLSEWALAGVERLQRTRRRGMVLACWP